ncbi:MAG TPA: archaeosortase/exosortase family protein, partial [Tepidisphaeraceae bacterium]|nr:archaeosortase/exosortase family protein [Tepidisphaeraceae bacterium]
MTSLQLQATESDAVPRSERASATRVLGPRDVRVVVAILGLAVLVMCDAWRDIIRVALIDEEVGYVFLAPLAIGWLLLVRRDRWNGCPIWGQWFGALGLMGGILLYWYGYFVDPALWRAGAVVTLVSSFVATAGLGIALRFAPVMVATVFLIPVDPNGRYRFSGPLQEVAARVTQDVCDLLSIQVMRSGELLTINGVKVNVAE